MTAPMAKFYLTQIRGRVRTTTKLAIKLNEVSCSTQLLLIRTVWEAGFACACRVRLRAHTGRGVVRRAQTLMYVVNVLQGMILDGDIAGQGQTSSALHFAFW